LIWLEQVAKFQGVIGAIVGFSLSYFSNKTGNIKVIEKQNYLSSPREGIEKEKRTTGEIFSTDYFYSSKKYITLNLELLFINTSSVNKVITDIEIEGVSKNKSSYLGIPLAEVEQYEKGEFAEQLADNFAPLSDHFHMLSLKAGEARMIKFLAFLDYEHFENSGGVQTVKLCYAHPEKRSKRQKRKKKLALNKWINSEEMLSGRGRRMGENLSKRIKNINEKIEKFIFGKLVEEEEKSKMKFVNRCNKSYLISELEEKLRTLPIGHALSENENKELILLLKKTDYDDMDRAAIERMKIIFETTSQHFSNLNNVVFYLTLIFGFITPSVILIVSNYVKDMGNQLAILGFCLVSLVFLYIAGVLVGLKRLERQHRDLSQISKYLDLIINTKL